MNAKAAEQTHTVAFPIITQIETILTFRNRNHQEVSETLIIIFGFRCTRSRLDTVVYKGIVLEPNDVEANV